MQVTHKSRLQVRAQNVTFVVLFLAIIGMLGWLSTRYAFQADWTATQRNTLSEASAQLLKTMTGPITITAYATEDESVRRGIQDWYERYHRIKPDVTLSFVNPEKEPEQVRQLGVSVNGEWVLNYSGRSEHVREFNEQNITNTLQRLARAGERWVVFLSGHGERNPHGAANHDLDSFVRQLSDKGIKVETVNLATTPTIPNNTNALVIAGPQADLLPGEIKIIRDYVDHGGNLLWLSDPGSLHGLQPLAEQLGVEFYPGVIVDPTTQLFGINDPRFAIVAEYPPHAITRGFSKVTLFPQAAGIDFKKPEGWDGGAFLETVQRSWSETGKLNAEIAFDKGKDIPGPLAVGVALTREVKPKDANADAKAAKQEQRVIITGDGDFLSNAFVGNGGNLDLGLNMVNWLSHDDSLVSVPAKTAVDRTLQLSKGAQILIGFGFLLFIPALLISSGVVIWLKRRKQ